MQLRHTRSSGNSGTANYTLLAVFSFLMAALLALINMKFLPENDASPFETHGLIMPMFVVTVLVYAITLLWIPYSSQLTNNINLLSGSLGAVLLTFILFPSLGWFILLIWVIYFVKLIYYACRKLCQLYKQNSSVSHLFNQLRARRANHDEETILYFTSSNCVSTARNHSHAILCFPVAVLLALLPLKLHSMNISALFETHSSVMSIFVIATLVYAIPWAIEAELQTGNKSHQIIISKISLLSGSLASVLLVLVIVPTLGWLVLLVWTLFLAKLIYDACQKLRHLYQAISSASNVFNEVLGRGACGNEPGTLFHV